LRDALDFASRSLRPRAYERLIENTSDGGARASPRAVLALAEASVDDAEARLRALADRATIVTSWREGGNAKRTRND